MPRPNHLFLADSDGNLYDTRIANWMHMPPLRTRYSFHHHQICSTHQLKAVLRAGKTTDLGGYPLYLVDSFGEIFAFDAANDRLWLAEAFDAIRRGKPYYCEINYEDTELECACTGKRIPSAYGDDTNAE